MAESQLKPVRSPLAIPDIRLAMKSDPTLIDWFPMIEPIGGNNNRAAFWRAVRLGLSEHVRLSTVYDLVKAHGELRRGWPSGLAAIIGDVVIQRLDDGTRTHVDRGIKMHTELHGAGTATFTRRGAAQELVASALGDAERSQLFQGELHLATGNIEAIAAQRGATIVTPSVEGNADCSAIVASARFETLGVIGTDVQLVGPGANILLAGLGEQPVELFGYTVPTHTR